MRILICDDDDYIVEQLQKYIQEFFHRNHYASPEIAAFHDGESLLKDKGEKDMVFLDVEMKGLSGIYVGNKLKQENERILIFIVTSFMEYLDDAMRCRVFRYLTKPLDKERLFRNLKDAIRIYNSATYKIPIETKEGVHTINTSELIFVESISHKIILHTTFGDFESIHPLKYWLDTLPTQCFFQTHKSFLVNFKHVTDFDHSVVHLYNARFTAYLTKRKYNRFKDAFLLYMDNSM